MIEIPRKIARFGASGIFRGVSGLNGNDKISGYLEQYYSRGSVSQGQGIQVEDVEKLEYAELVAKGYGIHLSSHPLGWGMIQEDKFYQLASYLVNGSIISVGYRREFFGNGEGWKNRKYDTPIKVCETMPERTLKIMAETMERVKQTAHMVKLPLEELVFA